MSEQSLIDAESAARVGSVAATATGEVNRRDSEAYYAFHAEVSGFPLEVVKVSHPLSQFPEAAYPPEGLALLDEVKKFTHGHAPLPHHDGDDHVGTDAGEEHHHHHHHHSNPFALGAGSISTPEVALT